MNDGQESLVGGSKMLLCVLESAVLTGISRGDWALKRCEDSSGEDTGLEILGI